MAERFENLDNILRDWLKEKIQKTVSFLENDSEKYSSSLIPFAVILKEKFQTSLLP